MQKIILGGAKAFVSVGCVFVLLGCGDTKTEVVTETVVEKQSINSPFTLLKNVHEEEQWVKDRAKAVVKLSFAGGMGTGYLASEDGVLISNFHVIGDACFREGCKVSVHHEYELGASARQPVDLWAEPVALWSKNDVVIWQLYESRSSRKKYQSGDQYIGTTDVGKIKVGDELICIGHPHGALKKVGRGQVSAITGDSVISDVSVMPGASGSPCFNKTGEVVSLVFAAEEAGQAGLSRSGIYPVSISTELSVYTNFVGTWKAEGVTRGLDILKSWKDVDWTQVISHERFFQNLGGYPKQYKIEGRDPFFNYHLKRCEALVESNFVGIVSLDVFAQIHQHCFYVANFAACSAKSKSPRKLENLKKSAYYLESDFEELNPLGAFCPSFTDRILSRKLAKQALDIYYESAVPGHTLLGMIGALHFGLEGSRSRGVTKAREAVEGVIRKHDIDLDQTVVRILLQFATNDNTDSLYFDNTSLIDFWAASFDEPGWENKIMDIVSSGYFITQNKHQKRMSHQSYFNLVLMALESEKISYHEFVAIESWLYGAN